MRINGIQTTETILKEIGSRIKRKRISLSITQKDLAREAHVSLRTIVSVEKGENISFWHIISILRVLKIADNLELLIPEILTDPFEVLKLGHKRQRVSKSKTIADDWKWGDEDESR